jgi:hypothetical protein
VIAAMETAFAASAKFVAAFDQLHEAAAGPKRSAGGKRA